MPNLQQLREKVYRAMDFNPQLEAYRDGITADLNDAYIHLSCQHPWLFLKKKSTLTLKRQATNANTSGTIEIAASNLRLITFSGFTPPSSWEGQEFVGPDDTKITIGAVNTNLVYLTKPYAAAVSSGNTDWQVNYVRYLLPDDCVETASFVSVADDQGILEFVDNDNEELWFFDPDQTGQSRFIVESENVSLLGPETPPTLAVASSGSLDATQEYEYCYTFAYKGVESSPSPTARATTTGSNKTINLSALPDTRWFNSSKASNKIKNIYRRRVDGSGRWVFIGNVADSVTTFSDDNTNFGNSDDEREEDDLFFEESPRQAVSAWWVPDEASRDIELRYQRRPRKLVADSDVPEWPVQYHFLIVWWGLREICLQHGMTQQAASYAKLADPLLRQMKAKYLSRAVRRRVRRSWVGGTVYKSIYGTPSKS